MSEKIFGTKKQGSIKDIPLPNKDSVHTLDLGNTHSTPGSSEGGGGNHDGSQGGDSGNKNRDTSDWTQAKRKNKRMGYKIGIAAILVLLAVIAYSFLFHSGTLVVQERSTQAVLANEAMNAVVDSENAETLSFTRISPFSKTETLFVEGSEEENRQTKATGELTVYNTDSTEKNYIKNTRFKTEGGLVYRAFNRFTIPAGSEENPGETRVLVVAENPGEKYNSESGHNFKLPALKEQGDPAYDAVSAQQAEPLTGGYSGVVQVPSEQDIQEAQVKLATRIENNLFDEFESSLGEDMITMPIFTKSNEPTYTEEVNDEKGGVNVVARTQMYGIAFDKRTLQEHIARAVLGEDVDVEGVVISNMDELEFKLTDNEFDPETSESVSFSVTGDGEFVWEVDREQVAAIAAGKLGSHIENNLVSELNDQSITEVSISPFWRRSLPNNTENIEIIITSNDS